MKWKTDTAEFYDTSWRKVFAFLPVKCIDGYTRLFCFVARSYRFNGDAPHPVYRPLAKFNHYKGA